MFISINEIKDVCCAFVHVLLTNSASLSNQQKPSHGTWTKELNEKKKIIAINEGNCFILPYPNVLKSKAYNKKGSEPPLQYRLN